MNAIDKQRLEYTLARLRGEPIETDKIQSKNSITPANVKTPVDILTQARNLADKLEQVAKQPAPARKVETTKPAPAAVDYTTAPPLPAHILAALELKGKMAPITNDPELNEIRAKHPDSKVIRNESGAIEITRKEPDLLKFMAIAATENPNLNHYQVKDEAVRLCAIDSVLKRKSANGLFHYMNGKRPVFLLVDRPAGDNGMGARNYFLFEGEAKMIIEKAPAVPVIAVNIPNAAGDMPEFIRKAPTLKVFTVKSDLQLSDLIHEKTGEWPHWLFPFDLQRNHTVRREYFQRLNGSRTVAATYGNRLK